MTQRQVDLLEGMIEALIQRMIVVKAIGKNQPIVEALDIAIDGFKNDLVEDKDK